MADLGSIIGSAIAGGLQGGGAAAEKSLASSQDALQKEDLIKMQNQLDEAKQMRILEATQAYDKSKTEGEHTFQVGRDTANFAHQDTRQDKDIAAQTSLHQMDNKSAERRTAMSVGGELAAANIHASIARAQLAAEQNRGTVHDLADGTLGFIPNNGGPAQQVMIPDAKGNMTPAMTSKIPEGAKIVLQQLAKQQNDTVTGTDESRAAAGAAIRDLVSNNYDLGKIGGKFISPFRQTQFLADYAKGGDEAVKAMKTYDAATGIPGSAKAYLTQMESAGTAAPSKAVTAPGATGLPGTKDAGAGMSRPPLPTTTSDPMGSGVDTGEPAPVNATAPAPTAPRPTAPAPVNRAALSTTPASTGSGLIAQQQAAQPTGLAPLVAGAQTTAPATQQAFRAGVDAFGRPIQQNPLNPIGLPQ